MKTFNILILLVALSIVSCSHRSPTIVFILPDGFNGLLLISEDKQSGMDMSVANGQYTLDVPSSGKLVVKSLEPFTEWHKETGRYKNGTIVPGETPSSETVNAIWPIPSVPGHGYYFLVGTRQDYTLVSRAEPEKLPLATKIVPSMLDLH